MPTIAEMCDVHYEFESQRGLLDHNTGLFALHRLNDKPRFRQYQPKVNDGSQFFPPRQNIPKLS